MKIVKAILVAMGLFLGILCIVIIIVESDVRDLGPVPVYEKQDELDALINIGKTRGLTAYESERLQMLSEERKMDIDAYYEKTLQKGKKGDGGNK